MLTPALAAMALVVQPSSPWRSRMRAAAFIVRVAEGGRYIGEAPVVFS